MGVLSTFGRCQVRELTQAEKAALRESVRASPDLQASLSASIPIIPRELLQENVQRQIADIAKALAPFRETMLPQLVETAKIMAPLQVNIRHQLFDTARMMTPVAENMQRQLADLTGPMSEDLQRQLAELAAFTVPLSEEVQRHAAAAAGSLGLDATAYTLPAALSEAVEQARLTVSGARPRTPAEVIAYIALWTAIISLVAGILGIVPVLITLLDAKDQPPTDGDTRNSVVINNSPTHVTNNTTVVVQPPGPEVTEAPAPAPEATDGFTPTRPAIPPPSSP